MDLKSNFKCDLCNVCVAEEKAFAAHTNGKKHNLALKMKHCEVCVKGLPQFIDEVEAKKYFASLGILKSYYFAPGNEFVVLHYKTEEIAQNIIKNGITYCGQKLIVQPTIGSEFIAVPEIEKSNPQELVDKIPQNEPFEVQVGAFLQIAQPHFAIQMEKYEKLCADLHFLLNIAYPKCILHPFGSTTTGLFFPDSDVDIFVELPSQQNRKTSSLGLVYKARNILEMPVNTSFMNIIVIPKGKVPIVKCIHLETNIHCDFHFTNLLGVCNSNLIKYYISLDETIKPLMMILKLWAKINGLMRRNFNSYSVIIMCVFYLQKCFSMPSVKDLQKNAKPENMHGFWNASFLHLPYHNEDIRGVKIIDLLIGFFEFYLHFDFSTNIICPFLGYEIPKTYFNSINELPFYYNLYKKNSKYGMELDADTPICVQDPFEHSVNITKHVNKDTFDNFQNSCRNAGILLAHQSLHELFANELSEIKILESCKDEVVQFRVRMGNCLNYLEKQIKENPKSNLTIDVVWYHMFENFLYTVLQDIFQFNLDATFINKKDLKSDEAWNKEETYNNAFDILKIHCVGQFDLWTLRRSSKVKFTIPSNIDSILQKEEYISNQMTSSTLITNKIKCTSDINMYIRAKVMPTEVEFQIKANPPNKCNFKAFTSYFIKQIPSWYLIYEKELEK